MKSLKSLLFCIFNLIFCLSILIFGIQRASAKEINIYSYRSPTLLEPFTKEYEKEFSVKFNVLHAKKGLAQRLKSEGKNSPADVILTVDISRLSELADMDLVKNINSDIINKNVPDHLRDINKKWISLSTRARIIGVSKERVNKNEINDIEDLAKPKFRGKICTRIGSHPYNRALLASIIAHKGEAKAKSWAEGLVSNFARKPKGNDRAQAKGIYSGECDIVLMNTYYFALMKFNEKKPEQKNWARATEVIFYNQGNRGQHVNISGAAIAKYSKNSEEALRFIEWLTMPKAQKIYANVNFEYPVNPKVKLDGKIMEWGTFKSDSLPISEIAKNAKKAQMIIDQVGW
jgi:iron(III) transport system substrate-binding protein